MKKQIKLQESAGRTVERVYCLPCDKSAYLLFTDGTFSVLTATADYDGCAELAVDTPVNPASDSDRYYLVRAGVMDKAEADVIEVEQSRLRRLDEQRREQALYERLKSKYGE